MFKLFRTVKEFDSLYEKLTTSYHELRKETRANEFEIKNFGEALFEETERRKELERQVEDLLDRNTKLALEIVALKQSIPEYQKAVERGVDEVWTRAVQSIIDFDPFKKKGPGDD